MDINNLKSIEEFYKFYKIEEFYDKQSEWSESPIKPFIKGVHKKFSHGKIPGYRNYDLFYERYKSAVQILMDKDQIKPGMKILDVGSGEGFFKFFFDAMYPDDLEWHGVEIWKERAEFCRHIGYKIDELNLEDGNLPYEDGAYDVVMASHVIEHIPNPSRIIAELGRVLKKGGILLIATPTKLPIIAEIDSLQHKLSKRKIGATQQAFTHNGIEKLTLDSLHLKKDAVIDKRGFRIISGRKKLPIENWKWFYNLSISLGKKLMFFVPEINLIIKK